MSEELANKILQAGVKTSLEEQQTVQFMPIEEYHGYFQAQNVPLTSTNGSILVDNILRVLFCFPQLAGFLGSASMKNAPRRYWNENLQQFVDDPQTTLGTSMNANVMFHRMNSYKFLIRNTLTSKKWYHLYETAEQKAIFETYFCSLLASFLILMVFFMILVTK